MRYEDEFDDLPQRLRVSGVSPAWRVVAILTIITTGILLILVCTLGLALLIQSEKHAASSSPVFAQQAWQAAQNQAGPQGFPNQEEDEDEPANPPYPLKADLQPSTFGLAEEPAAPARQTARDRFLKITQEFGTLPRDQYPQHVSIAPDGLQVAYTSRNNLMVGAIGGMIMQVLPDGFNIQPRRLDARGAAGGQGLAFLGVHAEGPLAWSEDSWFLYFADSDGRLQRLRVQTRQVENLNFHGDCPLPMPGDANQLIFRRSHAVPKIELSGMPALPDPSEIVLADLLKQETRVLIPENQAGWKPMAISPDGKKLAVISSADQKPNDWRRLRLYVLELGPGHAGEPRPITPLCMNISNVQWERDSKALVYARSQTPLPPDCWEADVNGFWQTDGIYRYDLKSNREVRLSRGRAFDAPALAAENQLVFLAWKADPQSPGWRAHRAPYPAVLEYNRREPELPVRDAASWARCFETVLKETGLSVKSTGEQLTAEKLAQAADALSRQFREQFKTECPASLSGWDQVWMELQALELHSGARSQANLVLAIAQGEFLRRKYGAQWRIAPGPLSRGGTSTSVRPDQSNPFGYVTNPFEPHWNEFIRQDDDDDEPTSPRHWLRQVLVAADGRTVILSNDPAEGQKAAQALVDPDLDRVAKLFEQGKPQEAEKRLLEMLTRKKYEKNSYLALHVGKVLYDNKRFEACRQLLESRVRQPPADPMKYNLLGLALLEIEPRDAVSQFKSALRCNLMFGPAYLNLAQAYQKLNDRESARLCLKRYLKLLPYGPLAADARQRLAALAP